LHYTITGNLAFLHKRSLFDKPQSYENAVAVARQRPTAAVVTIYHSTVQGNVETKIRGLAKAYNNNSCSTTSSSWPSQTGRHTLYSHLRTPIH